MIKVVLPPHLRTLAGVRGDVELEVKGPVTLRIIEDGNHIANNRAYRWRSHSADWMADQLRAAP